MICVSYHGSQERRELALKFMNIVKENFGIIGENQYVTFTEHKGEGFSFSWKISCRLAKWKDL